MRLHVYAGSTRSRASPRRSLATTNPRPFRTAGSDSLCKRTAVRPSVHHSAPGITRPSIGALARVPLGQLAWFFRPPATSREQVVRPSHPIAFSSSFVCGPKILAGIGTFLGSVHKRFSQGPAGCQGRVLRRHEGCSRLAPGRSSQWRAGQHPPRCSCGLSGYSHNRGIRGACG